MDTREFLEIVWPESGLYCIVGKNEQNKLVHRYVDTIDDALNAANELHDDQWDVYFACSTFHNREAGRKQGNAKEQRAFWVDLDCGFNKKNQTWKEYKDKNDAIAASRVFCDNLNLPYPTIVDSGNGVHLYWHLDEPIPTDVWRPLAEGLKMLCVKHDLRADPACTSDPARILRVPFTTNFKDPDHPMPVRIVREGAISPLSAITEVVPVLVRPVNTTPQPKRPMDAVTTAILGDYSANFHKIMKRSINGDGCAQLMYIATNQSIMPEPLWRSALSIAAFCDDRDTSIHRISKFYPEYTFEATERKANLIPKPHTCAEFESKNPAGCVGCPHKGKIKTPIVLGRVVNKAETQESRVIAKSEELGNEQEYIIPPYPHPYFRGKQGGIYKAMPDDEEDGFKIYDYDFYLVERLNDPDPAVGESVWFKLHLPHDGVREFIAPTAHMLSKEKARDILISKGVIAYGKQLDAIIEYVSVATQTLQRNKEAELMYKKYGWTESENKVLIGSREISAFGTKFVPVANVLNNVNKSLNKKGSFEVWKDTINTYARPGMELRAFGFFCGFGSLLMPFLEQPSAVVNLFNPESGQGKTAILKAMTSIYGDPREEANLMLMYGDTMNAIVNRLGYMGNIPQAIDEMTDPQPKDIQDLVKFVSGKRGKNRMVNGVNGERINDTTFNLIVVASSNTDWRKVMFGHKAVGSGEVNRFIQLKIEQDNTLSKTQATAIFDRLHHNFGHAAEPFAEYLVKNLDSVKDLLKKMQMKIDREFEVSGKDRFFSATFASVFTGALLAKQLKLHDIPLAPVYEAIKQEFIRSKADLKERDFNAVNSLTDYINSHLRDILVINGNADKRTGIEQAPIIRPMNSLMARIEPDTELMYIPVSSLKDYCQKINVDHADFVLGLKRAKMYVKTENKNVNKGLGIAAAGTRCVWISTRGIDALNPENLELDIPKSVN